MYEFAFNLLSHEHPHRNEESPIPNNDPPVIQGRLTDAQTGDPIPFASIRIEGTSIGAASDIDGYFKIVLPEDAESLSNFTLLVSSVGYETLRYTLKKPFSDQQIRLNLKMEAVTLGIVIVDKKVSKKQKKAARK